ncbi:MAG: 50S ribosomal protein L17 [bacterium]|nr:50S ribosomal protein L17 [bacterium]
MNKRKVGRTFSRKRDVRKAFLRDLSRSMVLHGRIQTTDARARELRRIVERLVTHAKKETLASRRYLVAALGKDVAKKFIDETEKKFSTRNGGYTRIIKQESRKSDGAKLAIIEFV